MYDPYIVRRTQIYLDADQRERLAKRAKSSGVTSSHVIREAVESYVAGTVDETIELARQRQALEEAFAFPPISRLPEGSEYVATIREAGAHRASLLEDRWRTRA